MARQLDPRGTIEERIYSRFVVDPFTGCHNWTGALSAGKYGSIYYEGRMQKAHRVRYQLECGPVNPDHDLDHLCRNTRCINPAHLEPVTRGENLRRSPLMDRNSKKTHCSRGHEFSPENTRIRANGWRTCKACMRMHMKEWRKKNVA